MGGPAVEMPTHQGFGTRIIERMIGQLKGKARFDWLRTGSFVKSPFGREVRNWPSTDLARCPAFGRCQGLNGPNADFANRSFVTHTRPRRPHSAVMHNVG